ncbi:hypothetical protein ACFW6Q_15165 [Streptomyces sp. NPDC058737]|uniref:hypothetical protein n=1 Tax=Streptomyces sp. NPDC058737 TaxID=3346617 RepID=UPI0036B10B48
MGVVRGGCGWFGGGGMSAPLVINTRDGACWTRRTVTEGGIALYALADVCSCPEFVMATQDELAQRGIVGSADALPMPTGPEPVSEAELDAVLTEVSAFLRVRLALESAKRGRRELRAELHTAQAHGRTFLEQRNAHAKELLELRGRLRVAEDQRVRALGENDALRKRLGDLGRERETLRERVAELEAAQGKALRRTVTWRLEVQENDCWWDCGQPADSYPAAQNLLARERAEKPGIGFRLVCRTTTDTLPGEATSYPPALPWAKHMDADDLEGFLADLAEAASGDDDLTTLAAVEDAIGRWRVIGEAQHAHNTAPGPDAEAGEPS